MKQLEAKIVKLEVPLWEAQDTIDRLVKEGKVTERHHDLAPYRRIIAAVKLETDKLREHLGILKVQQYANDPKTRWEVKNAMGN